MRRAGRVRLAFVTSLALLAGLLGVLGPVGVPPAEAADPTAFDAGMIITDELMTASTALSRDEIRAFLVKKGAACTDYTSGGTKYTCLKNYEADYAARAANANCSAISAGNDVTAATIIQLVSVACRINPQVLIVLLQKEQGLITSAKNSTAYKWATGYACPDTAACDTKYAGFFNQVYSAGWQFRQYMQPLTRQYMPGRDNTIKYHPNASCGTAKVYIRNLATAALYTYTPYVPNKAALNAGYGTGDNCSAYGNRNFFNYFADWFGSPGNLLKNANFSKASSSWGAGSSGSILREGISDTATAQAGGYYLAVTAPAAGRRLQQDAKVSTSVGNFYTAGLWVRPEDSAATVSGVVKVWTLGGTRELAQVPFTVTGSAWQQVTVNLAINLPSHTGLRFAVELSDAGETLFVDSAYLYLDRRVAPRAQVALEESRVGSGINGGWRLSDSSAITISRIKGDTFQGSYRGAALLKKPGGFAGQFIKRNISSGTSYTFGIWLRSNKPGEVVEGQIRLAGYGGTREDFVTPYSVGYEWTYFAVTADMVRSGHTELKVYLDPTTVGKTLQFDSPTLLPNLVTADSSFERGMSGLAARPSGTTTEPITGDETVGRPIDGVTLLRVTRTTAASSSIQLDVSRRLGTGESYSATVWVKSATPGTTYDGTLRLAGRTSSLEEGAEQPFTATDAWTQVTVKVTTSLVGLTALRTTLSLDSGEGTALLVDGFELH